MIIENGVLIEVFEDDIVNGTFEIPKEVTSIYEDAFIYLEKLESVVFHDNVTSIGKKAFSNCRKLKYVHLPDS